MSTSGISLAPTDDAGPEYSATELYEAWRGVAIHVPSTWVTPPESPSRSQASTPSDDGFFRDRPAGISFAVPFPSYLRAIPTAAPGPPRFQVVQYITGNAYELDSSAGLTPGHTLANLHSDSESATDPDTISDPFVTIPADLRARILALSPEERVNVLDNHTAISTVLQSELVSSPSPNSLRSPTSPPLDGLGALSENLGNATSRSPILLDARDLENPLSSDDWPSNDGPRSFRQEAEAVSIHEAAVTGGGDQGADTVADEWADADAPDVEQPTWGNYGRFTPPPEGFNLNLGDQYVPFHIHDESGRRWPAKFTRIDTITDDPQVYGYRSGSPTMYSARLMAQPVENLDPVPRYGAPQLFMLDRRHPSKDLVNDALEWENDHSLSAEVRRFRGLTAKRDRLFVELQDIEDELAFNTLERTRSVRRLREADIFDRLKRAPFPELVKEIEQQECGREAPY